MAAADMRERPDAPGVCRTSKRAGAWQGVRDLICQQGHARPRAIYL